MTPEQIQNVRNLIKANRESKMTLDMDHYAMNDDERVCKTACCVLGNYANRNDLQTAFSLGLGHTSGTRFFELINAFDGWAISWANKSIRDHFGLSYFDCEQLFAPYYHDENCVATTCHSAAEAADFIERWLEAKLSAQS